MTASRVSAALAAVDPAARWRVGVVAKRTYTVHNARLSEAPAQVGLVEAPVLARDGVALLHDTDLMLRKSMVDVVVLGHVYPHEDSRRCTVNVHVGALRRTLAVAGDRRIERDARGEVRFTPPERFERIPLAWERAYGGHDAAALAAYGDPTEALRREAGVPDGPHFGLYAYPRNPVGRGYLVELTEAAIQSCQLPNLEDPAHLLVPGGLVRGNSLAWPGGPPPASTAWMPYSFFPRSTLLGFLPPMFDEEAFPARDFHEVREGLLPARSLADDTHVATMHDLRAAQGSAPGMRAAEVLPGDLIALTNVHPRHALWKFPLEVRRPRMMIHLEGQAPQPLVPAIRSVLLEPDEDRVCLVWVGEIAVDLPLTPDQLMTVQHAVIWA